MGDYRFSIPICGDKLYACGGMINTIDNVPFSFAICSRSSFNSLQIYFPGVMV